MREFGVPRPAPFGFSRVVFLSHVITAGGPMAVLISIAAAAVAARFARTLRLLRADAMHRLHEPSAPVQGSAPPSPASPPASPATSASPAKPVNTWGCEQGDKQREVFGSKMRAHQRYRLGENWCFSSAGECVVLAWMSGFGLHPFASEKALAFEATQQGVHGALGHR